MSDKRILQKKSLGALFEKLQAAGRRILAPVQKGEQIGFEEVPSPQAIAASYVQTTRSAKAVLFPRYEPMLHFGLAGKDVTVTELPPKSRPTVLFGVRPCDAASLKRSISS